MTNGSLANLMPMSISLQLLRILTIVPFDLLQHLEPVPEEFGLRPRWLALRDLNR
jgi:hypothetical protein